MITRKEKIYERYLPTIIKEEEDKEIKTVSSSNLLPLNYTGVTYLTTTRQYRWYKNGKLHREKDKPAIIDPQLSMAWFKHGKKHRGNGQPAWMCISTNQQEIEEYKSEYWINGKIVSKEAAEIYSMLFKNEKDLL